MQAVVSHKDGRKYVFKEKLEEKYGFVVQRSFPQRIDRTKAEISVRSYMKGK